MNRLSLLTALALLLLGALLGLCAALAASPIDRPPEELLGEARALLQSKQPLAALAFARHVQKKPNGLEDAREADAVAAQALVALGRCGDAQSLLNSGEAAAPLSPRLQAECCLVRMSCSLEAGDVASAQRYLQQIITIQAGMPVAASARAVFNRYCEESGDCGQEATR